MEIASKYEHVIAPPGRFPTINWRELWGYRDLFLVLAWRDIAIRYKQTALGFLWALFQPFVTMVVFTFIFNTMAAIDPGDGTPYPIFVYVGLLLWQYFSNTLTNAANSMVQNAGLIQKVYFPRLIIPATAATTGLVDFALASLILAGMTFYYRWMPHLMGLLMLPVLLLTAVLAALGFGLFTAAVNVKYRDIRHAVPFIVQVMMFITPVVYPASMLDKIPLAKTLMIWLNPVSGVITNARAGILGGSPVDWSILATSLAMSFVFFIFGLYYFRKAESYFADLV
ncbi:MAG: ABC transporter permease [Armatimonadetes bacterium]|nr:ABC transporter permease [Armatimonadota bacterium]